MIFILRLRGLPTSPLAHQPETFRADSIRHLITSEISFQEDIDPSIARILYTLRLGKKLTQGQP